MSDIIRVFVGNDANGCDIESLIVLEYSFQKYSSKDIEFYYMSISDDPNGFWSGWETSKWSSPFSGFRWAIPEACNFEGKAIYTDSDVFALRDIAELWDEPFEHGNIIQAKKESYEGDIPRFCTMLWDCEAAKNYLPSVSEMRTDPDAHLKLMHKFGNSHRSLVQPYKRNWNCIDGEDLPLEEIINEVGILHHSNIGTQLCHKHSGPRLASQGREHWFNGVKREHPRQDLQNLFDELLSEAFDNGYTIEDYEPSKLINYEKEDMSNYDVGNKFSIKG